MEITERDIKRVEKIFFNGTGSFEDEQKERYSFISCIDKSIDVEACPGSGKTTSLLAKLYLLSEKMPFENGKGICVLTHTNVAINEIKQRLGNKADRLFQYPNFFGTIQSFVDRYLAIPYYAIKNKKRPNAIDSEWAFKRLLKSHIPGTPADDMKSIRTFLHTNKELGYKLTIKRTEDNQYELVKGISGERVNIKKPRSRTDWSQDKKVALYDLLFKLKTSVLRDSAILSFDDAYFYANECLRIYPQIRFAISKRFSHVFIDEMQDTYVHQDEIIRTIFDDNTIIQRIGDPNQAILNDNNSNSAWEDSERLKITGSRRFSQPIANILKTVALYGDSDLTGYGDAAIPSHIIPYQKGNESEVLEKFVSLIHDFGLHGIAKKHPIKAVGWVGKVKEGLTINSYFGAYSKALVKKKSLANLKSAVLFCDTTDPKEFNSTIIDCFLELLRLAGIKNATPKGERFYTKTSLVEQLKKKHFETLIALNTNIAKWGQQLGSNNADEIVPVIRDFLINDFFPALDFALNDKSLDFIKNDKVVEANKEQLKRKNVFYSQEAHLSHIPVEIGTVHSVKGETHTATLYMETAYHGKTCGEYLIKQLCGEPYNPPKRGDVYKKSCLKIVHVGMSRPTHLLCLALDEGIVNNHKEKLEANGWIIV